MAERPTARPRRDSRPPPFAAAGRHRSDPPTEAAASSSFSEAPPSPPRDGAGEGNVDRELLDNLVEVVPLIERFLGQRVKSSFRRRAPVIHTPAPSSLKKASGSKNQKGSSVKNRGEETIHGGKDKDDVEVDESSSMSRPWAVECAQRDREEISILREQVDDLQRRLQEKEGQIKAAENSLNELKREMIERETSLRSAHSQLNNAKIKLADKQAALEKKEWEAREAKNNNMKLQGKLDSIDFEISSFMRFFMELSKIEPVPQYDDNIPCLDNLDQLPFPEVDEHAMEEARIGYLDALAAAKKNPSEEMLRIASEARMKLQAFVL